MALNDITRRDFLSITGKAAVCSLLLELPANAKPGTQRHIQKRPLKMYMLTVRRKRGAKASKIHNANMRFATKLAADRNRAFLGDNSDIVSLDVSFDEYNRLFIRRRSLVADLRHV